jgi:hypothetical protein
MATARQDIVIPQGGTFRLIVNVISGPGDITGFTGEMQVRKSKGNEVALVDVAPEHFTADNVNRQLVMEIPSSVTETYEWDGPAVYDLYLVGAGEARWRLVEGIARLSKTVTRED